MKREFAIEVADLAVNAGHYGNHKIARDGLVSKMHKIIAGGLGSEASMAKAHALITKIYACDVAYTAALRGAGCINEYGHWVRK